MIRMSKLSRLLSVLAVLAVFVVFNWVFVQRIENSYTIQGSQQIGMSETVSASVRRASNTTRTNEATSVQASYVVQSFGWVSPVISIGSELWADGGKLDYSERVPISEPTL